MNIYTIQNDVNQEDGYALQYINYTEKELESRKIILINIKYTK